MWYYKLIVGVTTAFLLWQTPCHASQPPMDAMIPDNPLVFGVVPQQSPRKLARKWVPLIRHLAQQTGLRIQFQTAPDIPTFEKRLAEGRYDLAYMNPYHYTVFHKKPGYRAIAREHGKYLRGVIVVAKDSPYQRPEDLEGKSMVFPSPAAFAASLLTQAYLKNLGVSVQPQYVYSHDSVYQSVGRELSEAGGGIQRTLNNSDSVVREQLRVLLSTDGYSSHAFAIHPRVPHALATQLQAALVGLVQTLDGKTLLKQMNMHQLEQAKDADWDDVRELDIHLLDSLIEGS